MVVLLIYYSRNFYFIFVNRLGFRFREKYVLMLIFIVFFFLCFGVFFFVLDLRDRIYFEDVYRRFVGGGGDIVLIKVLKILIVKIVGECLFFIFG